MTERVAAVLLALLAAASPAAGQGPGVTLDEAIDRSTRVQPRVVSAAGQVRNAEARIKSAKGAFLPN
ncbi:MAG TPA: hypothetical protein VLL51_10230, partial [Gemmatimonadales bacterium]|nr:hypothetical protein [Gemmatimonadales bacterium]